MPLPGLQIGRDRAASWLVFVVLAAVMLIITPDATSNPFDGQMRVAASLLHGEAHLPEGVTWIESFTFEGRRYIAYPPMTALVLVPYAALGGAALGQPAANSLLVFGAALLLYALLRRIPGLERYALAAPVLWVLGTPLLYSVHFGNQWVLMHSEGHFFLLLALLMVVARRSFFWAGLAFGIAVLTRYAILFSAPAFLLLAIFARPAGSGARDVLRALVAFAAGASIALAVVLAYNWSFFDDPWINPYTEAWTQKPRMTRAYDSWLERMTAFKAFRVDNVWRNLVFYVTAHPKPLPEFPYLRFDGGGESLLLLSPFLAGALFANLRLGFVRCALPGALLMLLFYLAYSYQGFLQFGSRYLSDIFPLLVPIALSGFTGSSPLGPRTLAALGAYSIAANAYGVWVVSHYGHY